MSLILFSLFADQELTDRLIQGLNCEKGEMELHQFPDEENAITIKSSVKNKNILLLADLEKPNQKILMLLFFAELARELGATTITLITPYLAYMRQDKRSKVGEGLSSKYFAQLLSRYFDRLITIEPHLHTYTSLNEIFTIPSVVLRATTQVASWIKAHVEKPLIIGPDAGAKEWASEIASSINAPFIVLDKIRKSDNEVVIKLPQMDSYRDYDPVLVDDLISTGKTMIEAIKELDAAQMKKSICIAVHGVFAGNAYQALVATSKNKVITCNTIKHISNEIDISELIVESLRN